MRSRWMTAVACVAVLGSGCFLSAQMSGTYTIDPSGTGSRNFKTTVAAAGQLVSGGVNGPVVFEIASAMYGDPCLLAPVSGASSTNTITFKRKTPLGARFDVDKGPAFTLNPSRGSWFVFDGLDFDLPASHSNRLALRFSIPYDTEINALGGTGVQAYFAVGASKTTVNLGGACNLLVSPDLVFVVDVLGSSGPGNGKASVKIALPNDPKLRGAFAHFQWGVVDPAAAGIGVALSNAATLTL